jgi:hypothetical protein
MKMNGVRVHGRRRVYVSWVLTDKERLDWKEEFWDRLDADTRQLTRTFDESLQSDPGESGELARQRLQALLQRKPEDTPVTDVVAVLTNEYLARNTDRGTIHADGELACFIDHVKAHDKNDAVRIYIAPVDRPRWDVYTVREVRLQDAGRVHRWLVRLREQRFTWPSESRAKCADEVAEAIELITGEPQESPP